MLEIIQSIDQLALLEKEWSDFYDCAKEPTVFQTFHYNYFAWVNYLAVDKRNRLYVVLSRDNKTKSIEAIFPFYLDGSNRIRFINDRHTDYCDALLLPVKNYFIVFKSLLKLLKSDPNIKGISLISLEASSLLMHALRVLNPDSIVYALPEYSYLPIDTHAEPFENFSHLNSKDKSSLRGVLKRSASFHFEVRTIKDAPFPATEIFSLKERMIQNGKREDAFYTIALNEMAKSMYEQGLLEVALLFGQDGVVEAIATLFCDQKRNRMIQWIVMHASPAHNLTTTLLSFMNAVESGVKCFDFGRGGYDYKLNNFQPVMKTLFCIEVPFNNIERIAVAYRMNLFLLKRFVKSYLKRNRNTPSSK